MEKIKIDINELIRNEIGYRPDREDFGEICKTANQLINKNNYPVKDGIDILKRLYGEPIPYLQLENPIKKTFNIFGEDLIDLEAKDQMMEALSLPVSLAGSIMPDGHVGYALPIGGVLGMDNAISPHFIGFDISCMVYLTVLDIAVEDLLNNKYSLAKDLDAVTSFGLGADFADGKREHSVMDDNRWNSINSLRQLKEKANTQLGSSGGGNHFADLMVITFNESFNGFKKGEQAVCLMTHSGSRGTGHKLATLYSKKAKEYTDSVSTGVPNGYEWLSMDTELGQEYWEVMQVMGDYALANHELIHKHFMKRVGANSWYTIWNRHNFAWKEKHFGKDMIVHRKGATPAGEGEIGLIPASMASPSRLVMGLGNELSMNSSSHGAGRYKSRTQAKADHNEEEHNAVIAKKGIITVGVDKDESYQAYKNIDDVMGYQEGILVDTIAIMEPHVVIMGGKSDDGD